MCPVVAQSPKRTGRGSPAPYCVAARFPRKRRWGGDGKGEALNLTNRTNLEVREVRHPPRRSKRPPRFPMQLARLTDLPRRT